MNKDQKEYADFWKEMLKKITEMNVKYDDLSENNKIKVNKDARKMLFWVRSLKGLSDYIKSHFC